jgi:hypothetical protein
MQYVPIGHVDWTYAVGDVEPAAQKKPDVQGPEQSGEVCPATLP